jgi:titin
MTAWRLATVAALLILVGFADIRGAHATISPCDGSAPPLGAQVQCTTPGTYLIPVTSGTTSVDVDLRGAGGGGAAGVDLTSTGGNAAQLTGSLSLPANTAYLKVIVPTGGAAGASGGGTGGGAAAIFALDSGSGLLAKLAIAGGGGGAGYEDAGSGGSGGNAGSVGADAADGTGETATGGGAGTGATGGAAGSGTGGDPRTAVVGTSDSASSATPASGGAGADAPFGGSGGGGYAGGGGGGANVYDGVHVIAAGGGGGSSLTSGYFAGSSSIASGTGGTHAAAGSAGFVNVTLRGFTAPSGLSATPGDTTVALSFNVPADDGGSAITGYQVSTNNGATWSALTTSGSGPLTATVTGLTNGTGYTVKVRAVNGGGPGPASSGVAVTPRTTPDAPTSLTATAANASASLTFNVPGFDGGSAITGYQVSTDNGVTWSALTTSGSGPLTATVTGLTNGTGYTVKVRAVNVAGSGASSSGATVTPATVPSAPTGLTATSGNAQALLSFTAPASGGSPITGYDVSTDNGVTWSALTTVGTAPVTATVTGLTNGTGYTIKVRARNVLGNGAASTGVGVTPKSTPSAPGNLTATPGNGTVSLSFSPPASDGGSPIVRYEMSIDLGAHWSTIVAGGVNPITANPTGFVNGTLYTIWIRGVNAVGGGAYAAVTVMPGTPPSAPGSLTATPGNGQIGLSFTAPTSNGGAAITGYEYTTDNGASWHSLTTTGSGPYSATLTGLTNGTAYTIQVRAINGVGSGTASATVVATPRTVPAAPATLTVTPGNGTVLLSFSPPADDGGSPVTSYQGSLDGVTWSTLSASGTNPITATMVGLTNGTTYTISVRAVNASGNGLSSAGVQATPRTVPGAPTLVSATPGNGQATVQFTAPLTTGGALVTGYEVSVDGGTTWSSLTTSGSGPYTANVSGLTNGTLYNLIVRAVNAAGGGASSSVVTVTPRTVPSAPTGLNATPGNGIANVSFTAPGNGGSAITGYEVSTDGGTTWSALTTSGTTTITGTISTLVNGTTYHLILRARNIAGAGTAATVSVTPRTVPIAPTALALAPNDQQIAVQFTAPTDDGGAPITGYEISIDAGVTWAALSTTGSSTLLGTVTGLVNGTTYTVQVRAVNAAGFSPASSTAQGTPRTTPGAPSGLVLIPADRQLGVQFVAPTVDGGAPISGYEVTTDNGVTWHPLLVTGSGPLVGMVSGLINGTQYRVLVRAVNIAGPGQVTIATQATPRTVPGAPVAVGLTPGDSQFTARFQVQDDGGSSVTGYEISIDGGSTWAPFTVSGTTTLTGVVTGLTNGTQYDVQLRALNVAGTGTASATLTVTPCTVPGQPSGLSATPGDGAAAIALTAPYHDGGKPITGYEFSVDAGSTWSPMSTAGDDAVTGTATGLTNGVSYTLIVRAVNGAGPGPASDPVQVTPRTVPGVPTGLVGTGGDRTMTLQFATPVDDGGAAVSGYELTMDGGATWSVIVTAGNAPAVARVDGLSNGVQYTVAVRALNAAGAGAMSQSADVAMMPATPDAPQVQAGIASVAVSWAPSSAAYVTGYTVTASPGPATCTTKGRTSTRCIIGATAGVPYTYTVVAHSASGDSAASAPSASATAGEPLQPLDAPTDNTYRLATLSGSLDSIRPLEQVTVVGSNLLPFGSVTILIYSTPRQLATTTSDAQGSFQITVTIPADLPPGPHTIVASGVDRQGVVRMLTLHGTYDPRTAANKGHGTHGSAPSSGSARSLSYTGTPMFQLAAFGIVSLCAGVVMLQYARRRSHTESS